MSLFFFFRDGALRSGRARTYRPPARRSGGPGEPGRRSPVALRSTPSGAPRAGRARAWRARAALTAAPWLGRSAGARTAKGNASCECQRVLCGGARWPTNAATTRERRKNDQRRRDAGVRFGGLSASRAGEPGSAPRSRAGGDSDAPSAAAAASDTERATALNCSAASAGEGAVGRRPRGRREKRGGARRAAATQDQKTDCLTDQPGPRGRRSVIARLGIAASASAP